MIAPSRPEISNRPSQRQRTLTVAVALALAIAGWELVPYANAAIATIAAHRHHARMIAQLRREWSHLAAGGYRVDTMPGNATLVEFADYQCPYCRVAQSALDSAIQSGTVRVSYHHYPLSDIHPAARGAAKAAICADAQSAFLKMHHYLMTTTWWQHDTDWVALADSVSIPDKKKFTTCLRSKATDVRLATDQALGDSLNVTGTPTFATITELHLGRLSSSQFIQLANADVSQSTNKR